MSGSYDRVMEDRKKLVEKIIENMKKGYILPKPDWNEGAFFPGRIRNPVSGSEYQGANLLRLYMAGIERHCTDGRWMTYKQAQSMGWQVKKGEQGVRCEKYIFTKQIEEENPETGKMEKKTIRLSKPMVNTFVVFNASQIKGIPEQEVAALEPLEPDQILEMAEAFQRSSECPIRETNEGRAYYDPAKDEIVLPNRNAFVDTQAFLATQLHEMVHSTGHQSRLNRPFSYFFGSPEYAMEELRAELGAFFIQNDFQLDFDAQHFNSHTQYLESWIQALENDPNELFRAIADAQKAASYLEKGYEQQIDLDREPLQEEMTKTTPKEPAIRFNGDEFEKLIPYNMRYKQFELVNGNEMYWITQEIFNEDDLQRFQQAIWDYDGDIKKFYVTQRNLSLCYTFKDDMANRVLAIVTPEAIFKDDYLKAVKEAGWGEYLTVRLTADQEAAVRVCVKRELKKTGAGRDHLEKWIMKDAETRVKLRLPENEVAYDCMWKHFEEQMKEMEDLICKLDDPMETLINEEVLEEGMMEL